ncbi:hypothetical protein Misp01_58490 [Microtetraspora sp. NBRC 13810]|nr:hypothetical protein Misp01_58490 [Microtetraspora sp. NBRC 13810]
MLVFLLVRGGDGGVGGRWNDLGGGEVCGVVALNRVLVGRGAFGGGAGLVVEGWGARAGRQGLEGGFHAEDGRAAGERDGWRRWWRPSQPVADVGYRVAGVGVFAGQGRRFTMGGPVR